MRTRNMGKLFKNKVKMDQIILNIIVSSLMLMTTANKVVRLLVLHQ